MRLIFVMWRNDGSLPNNPQELARIAGVHPPRWSGVWGAIRGMFTVKGDAITNDGLTAELGAAKAKIAVNKASARIGALTTQARARAVIGNTAYGYPMKEPKPLKNNDAGQANAKHNYNYKESFNGKGGFASPLPLNGEASASPEKGFRGEAAESPSLHLENQKPTKADLPPPPSSAPPPPKAVPQGGSDLDRAIENLTRLRNEKEKRE
jgi:uncharacterized protein YdaU (DUF1376 family)